MTAGYKKDFIKLLKLSGKKLESYLLPSDIVDSPDGMTQEQIRALNQRKALSDLLMYRYYTEYHEDGEVFGIYTQADGRRGFIFEMNLPSYAGEQLEKLFMSFYSGIAIEGVVVNISTFSSKNVDAHRKAFEDIHPCKSNVKNADILRELIKDREKHLDKWTKESMVKGSDFRLRNFITTLSVLFPAETPLETIKSTYSQVKGSMSQMLPENMPANRFISVIKEFINPDMNFSEKSIDNFRAINHQIAKGAKAKLSYDNGDLYFGEKTKARVFTTEKFPETVDLFDFTSIFTDPRGIEFQIALPCQFIVSLTIQYSNLKKKKKQVQDKAKNYAKNLNMVPNVLEKQFPDIKKKKTEAEQILEHLDRNEIPLDGMFTIAVFEENNSKLEKYSSILKKKFDDIDSSWVIREETFSHISFMSLLFSLPLQYTDYVHAVLRRMEILFKSNNAAITPIIGERKGLGLPLLQFLGRSGQILNFNLLDSKQNYNIVAVGPPGSGKSTFSNELQTMHLAAGFICRTVDLGDSYKPLSESFGGQYVKFTDDSNICLNFFTNIITSQVENPQTGVWETVIHEDELETIIPLIGYMAGMKLVDTKSAEHMNDDTLVNIEKKAIVQSIENCLQQVIKGSKGKNAGMEDLYLEISNHVVTLEKQGNMDTARYLKKINISLQRYGTPNGRYYKYFNGPFNVNFENDHFVLELEELSKKGELRDIVVLGMLQKIATEAFFRRDLFKLITLDEVAHLLENIVVVHYLEMFGRRIRKYGGILALFTQYLKDYFVNKASETLYEGSSFKIYLQQSEDAIEKNASDGHLSMNEFDIELMKSVKYSPPNYSEFMMKYLNHTYICRFKMTPFQYAMYTTKKEERQYMKNIASNYGLSTVDSLKFFAIKKEQGLSDDEILKKIAEESQTDKEKEDNISKILARSLQVDGIAPYLQRVTDVNNHTLFYEMLIRIKNEDIRPGEFIPVAIKKGYYPNIVRAVFSNCYKSLVGKDVNLSINIGTEEADIRFEEFFYKMIENSNDRSVKFTFEYDSTLLADRQYMEYLEESIAKAKRYNIKVAFDRIGMNIPPSHLIKYNPDYIKIDANLIKKIDKSEEARQYTELLTILSQKLHFKTVGVHIANEEIYAKAKEIGIDYFQGYYIDEPADIKDVF